MEGALVDLQRAMIDQQLALRRSMSSGGAHRERESFPVDLEAFGELRGSEQLIVERQLRYVNRFDSGSPVLDLGCGRGEFMQLLRDAGIEPLGVDSDPRMVAYCTAKGLEVFEDDAIQFLAHVPEASLGGIFSAQLIEHLEQDDLIRLVRLSARALRPGAPVVLETPNPESLITFVSFYSDLTHTRPYNADALVLVLRSCGFDTVEIEYSLPPDPSLAIPPLPPVLAQDAPGLETALQRLSGLMYGPLAYAAVARRSSG
jgi:O-antigen chain-terminating methyltransferase